jgi:hypothetical protein
LSAAPLADLLAGLSDEAHLALVRAIRLIPPEIFVDFLHAGGDGWESSHGYSVRVSRRRHGHRAHVTLEIEQPLSVMPRRRREDLE